MAENAQDRYVHVKPPRSRKKKPAQQDKKSLPYTQEQRDGQFDFDTINGLKLTRMEYTIPSSEERKKKRKEFEGNWRAGIEGERSKFLKYLAETHEKELIEKLGLTKTDIGRMKRGIGVKGYNVHHKLPIHGGGTNDFSNFILVPIYPHDQFHQDVMNPQIKGMQEGETRRILVPYTDDMIYNPNEFGFKKNNEFVQPNPPTRVDESMPYYVIKNYRPEHIGVAKRQKYMQSIYDADRRKAIAAAQESKQSDKDGKKQIPPKKSAAALLMAKRANGR